MHFFFSFGAAKLCSKCIKSMIDRYKSFYNPPYKGNLFFIILLNIYNECRLNRCNRRRELLRCSRLDDFMYA